MNIIPDRIESILTKQQLERDYQELKSLAKIAQKYGVSDVPIRARFIKYNIPFKSKIHYNKCNHNIFSEESERAFYLAGFLAADGCIRISKTNKNRDYINHRIVVALAKKDEKFLEQVRDSFDSNNKFNYYTHKLSKYSNDWNDCESVKLSITSKQMVDDLVKFGVVSRKSLTYTFPEWLKTHPLKHHFIRGYIDGDGSFYLSSNKKSIVFSVRGTIDFLKTCKTIFENDCNAHTKTIPTTQDGIGDFKINSNLVVSRIVDFIYKDATIFLERKYEIAKTVKDLLK